MAKRKADDTEVEQDEESAEPPTKKVNTGTSSKSSSDSRLVNASRTGNLAQVQELLEQGVDPNDPAVKVCTNYPLHYAAKYGKHEVIDALVKAGASVNVINASGLAPLHWAAEGNCKEACEKLINHGAQNDITSKKGETPLHIAARQGNLDTVTLLVESGADVNATEGEDLQGSTVLHEGVSSAKTNVVEYLVQNGALVDTQDKEGQTPLHRAAAMNLTDVMTILLDAGADVNATDTSGRTPLHWATISGKRKAVKLLVDNYSANIYAEDVFHTTPVQCANTKKFKKLIKFFKKRQEAEETDQAIQELTQDKPSESNIPLKVSTNKIAPPGQAPVMPSVQTQKQSSSLLALPSLLKKAKNDQEQAEKEQRRKDHAKKLENPVEALYEEHYAVQDVVDDDNPAEDFLF